MIFLQELTAFGGSADPAVAGGLAGGLLALILTMLWFFMIISIGLWVYTSFAFMAIAKKAKYSSPGIAWIPGIGPMIIAYKTSGMHWWPWLLIIGFFIPFVNIIAMIVFLVYSIIWTWKLFETIGKPGWWAIAPIIPIVGGIAYLVFIGIAAWSKM